jgi:hypothetical protein
VPLTWTIRGIPIGTQLGTRKALSNAGALPLFISGCAENQVKFYSQLTDVVLLSAPRDVILNRLSTRTNNPYGKTAAELEEVIRNTDEVEPLLRRGASYEIDTSPPLKEVVEQILKRVWLSNLSPGSRRSNRSGRANRVHRIDAEWSLGTFKICRAAER